MDSALKLPAKEALYKFLALEGGGAKGYVYVGVAQELEKLGLLQEVEEIAGSSVGAITDLYLAAGYTVEQIKNKIFDLDFKKMLLNNHYIMMPINWINKHGFFDAKPMHQKFKDIIKEITGNEQATFEQWHQFKLAHPERKLKDIIVEACNIGTGFNETFSYKSEHKDVPIADAIRASMAFPQVFTPMKIKDNFYSDGGIQNNCPMTVFGDTNGVIGKDVLGVCLENLVNIHYYLEAKKPPAKKIDTNLGCVQGQIEAMLNVQNYYLMTGPYQKQIIYCDTLDIGTLDFGLSKEQKEALAASGQYGVMRYIVLTHPELAEKFYSKETLSLLAQSNHPLSITEYLAYIRQNKPKAAQAAQEIEVGNSIHLQWEANSVLAKAGGGGKRQSELPTPKMGYIEEPKKRISWCETLHRHAAKKLFRQPIEEGSLTKVKPSLAM